MRKGTIPIDLTRIFARVRSRPCSMPPFVPSTSRSPMSPNGLQEIFGREELRNLVKAYEARRRSVRSAVRSVPKEPWTKKMLPRARSESGLGQQYQHRRTALGLPAVHERDVLPQPRGRAGHEAAPPQRHVIAPRPLFGHRRRPGSREPSTVQPATAEQESPAEGPKPTSGSRANQRIFVSLIDSRARQQAETSQADQTWLEATARSFAPRLWATISRPRSSGTRLTPNAALIRFAGSDRLRIEDIQNREFALLTTHGLRLVAVSPYARRNRRGRRASATAGRLAVGRLGSPGVQPKRRRAEHLVRSRS